MDFGFSADQESLRTLARQVFDANATQDRLKQLEAGDEPWDARLWDELVRTGLAAVATAEGGGGPIEACIVLQEQGCTVAPVPLWSAYVASMALSRFGRELAEGSVPTVALGDGERASVASDGPRLHGRISFVPAGPASSLVIVAVEGAGLFVVESPAATWQPLRTTSGGLEYMLLLDDVEAEPLTLEPGAVEWARAWATVAVCAVLSGVADGALRLTAEYTSNRHQFGRPLGSFQAVQLRAADAYIDCEAMRWTMWEAAWRLAEGRDAREEVAIAKFWAAEGGQRVLAACQHLHGGIGIDKDYPLHRYLYWAKQLELTLGGATRQLARLGQLMAGGTGGEAAAASAGGVGTAGAGAAASRTP